MNFKLLLLCYNIKNAKEEFPEKKYDSKEIDE